MKEKTITLEIDAQEYRVVIHEFTAEEATVSVNDHKYRVRLKDLGLEQIADLKPKTAPAPSSPVLPTSAPAPILHRPKTIAEANAVVAPLPGLIQHIHVKVGDQVKSGQHLLTMEAMKMENEIQAIRDGTVREIRVKTGDSVSEGDILLILE